jgi:acetyltransferase-like isoleucine patch superfamily enzyme
MIKRLRTFMHMPLSRKMQYISFMRDRLMTRWIYRWRLSSCGQNSSVGKPLFWTPEYIALGKNVLIWPGCRIEGVDSYAGNAYQPAITIGDDVTFQQRCHITAAGNLTLGARTTILFDVMITDIDHNYQTVDQSIYRQTLNVVETTIGEDCFIGSGARIQAGSHLGRQCIVGANAVVRGSYPDYSVLAGVPAKIIKRFNPTSGNWEKTDPHGNFINDQA